MEGEQERKTYIKVSPGRIKASSVKRKEDIPSSLEKYANLITESFEVKKQVREAINRHSVSLFALCQVEKMNYDRIKYWLNTRNPLQGRRMVSQNEILELCTSLGIQVRITIAVNRNHGVDDSVRHFNKKTSTKKGDETYDIIKDHERQRRENS
jgi:hypothetical protein